MKLDVDVEHSNDHEQVDDRSERLVQMVESLTKLVLWTENAFRFIDFVARESVRYCAADNLDDQSNAQYTQHNFELGCQLELVP